MLKYVLKRLLASAMTLMIVLAIVFILLRQMPIEGYFENYDKLSPEVRRAKLIQMGLTDPLLTQLKNFFAKLFKGDLGISTRYSVGASIFALIAQKAPLSMQIGLMSLSLSLALGVPLGSAMARGKSKFWDKFGALFIVFVSAVPAAVYYIFIQVYGTSIMGIPMLFDRGRPVTWILPVASMSLGNIAYYAMWLRRYMVDEMNKDYVRLARVKGVTNRRISMRHVFRNAFVPMIQYIPNSILYTIGGSIFIEALYSIPGMGGLLVQVIGRQDNPMVQVIVMIYSAIGIIGLLLGDLLMGMLDPRISFVAREGAR
jgi:oligopeptide transport system permease protein